MSSDERLLSLEHIADYVSNPKSPFNREMCEEMGASLTTQKFLSLLQQVHQVDSAKLTALLVGLPAKEFEDSLPLFNDHHLALLKPCAKNEPILHQLTQFGHAVEKELIILENASLEVENSIHLLDPHAADTQTIHAIFQEIHTITSQLQNLAKALSNALLIAWNGEREELISLLSRLKESVQRLVSTYIGQGRQDDHIPTGLYKKLEDRLMAVYSNKLNNDDPAIEALAALGIVYEDDFIETGLLDGKHKGKKDKAYLPAVEQKLAQLGLGTVGDVKKNQIYSRITLKKFIEQASLLLRL